MQQQPNLGLLLLWLSLGLFTAPIVLLDSGWPQGSWGDHLGFALFTVVCWPIGLLATIADCTAGHATYPRAFHQWLRNRTGEWPTKRRGNVRG